MAKAVVLKTNIGVLLLGSFQNIDGKWFDAESCFQYCKEETDLLVSHQVKNLISLTTKIGSEKTAFDWYEHRNNFIDVELPIKCSQEYKEEND